MSMPPIHLALVAMVTACASPASTDLVATTVAPAAHCPSWLGAAFELTATKAGTLEYEVIDRWSVDKEITELMGPGEVRYSLDYGRAKIGNKEPLLLEWAFADPIAIESPPAPGCARFADELSTARDAASSLNMCTRVWSRHGDSGGSASIFQPSCRSREGLRPVALARSGRLSAARGDWLWLAAWAWLPPEPELELEEHDGGWRISGGGESISPAQSPLPAWTLRVRLRD